MKYLETYREYQIYILPEAYLSLPQKAALDRYIAINPLTHQCIDDVTLGSLKAGIDENLR